MEKNEIAMCFSYETEPSNADLWSIDLIPHYVTPLHRVIATKVPFSITIT